MTSSLFLFSNLLPLGLGGWRADQHGAADHLQHQPARDAAEAVPVGRGADALHRHHPHHLLLQQALIIYWEGLAGWVGPRRKALYFYCREERPGRDRDRDRAASEDGLTDCVDGCKSPKIKRRTQLARCETRVHRPACIRYQRGKKKEKKKHGQARLVFGDAIAYAFGPKMDTHTAHARARLLQSDH